MNPIRPSRHRGVAAVELALMLPLFLLMSFTVTEFGRALYEYNLLTKSVRDAARYLSIQTPNTHAVEARNLILYGTPTAGSTPLVRELRAGNVPDPEWNETAGSDPVIRTVTVRISGYTFRSPYVSFLGISSGTIRFNDITATMRSHL